METTTIKLPGHHGYANLGAPLKRTWVARCRSCKAHRRLEIGEIVPMVNAAPHLICCDQQMDARILKGVFCETACGAKCRGSKGHLCECSCGGKNHGKDA